MAARRGKGSSGTRPQPARKQPARKPAARRRGAGRRRSGAQRLRIAARVAAALAFVAGFALASWLVRLDHSVVARFEGQRFEVPSKVMSAPLMLYPGLEIGAAGLEAALRHRGYRELNRPGTPPLGTYVGDPGRLRVHLRAFDHPTRSEPARVVGIRLREGRIAELRDLGSGAEMGAIMLEPEQVGAYYGPDREQRELVRLAEVPPHLIDAVLAVEDRRFGEHHGIDWRRIGGAVLANLRAGGIRQGGSTLTQQLVKNFFLTPERTLSRKLQEAAMALIVEARYSKEAILEAYLNEIYLGQRGSTAVHGVGEAAHLYFGKQAADLTAGESALIAAIIQSPNRISPHRDPERGRERRDLVLRLMHEQGRLEDEAYEQARREPLRVATVTRDLDEARYFLDVLRRQLPQAYDREVLSGEGLRIYSTLEPNLQRIAARALRRGLERAEKLRPDLVSPDPTRALQGCILALRPQTGEILALVGGRDYGRSQFDRCVQARRPVGSVFKPVVYVAALERPRGGEPPLITLASFLQDDPLEVQTPSGPWRPVNFDHEFRGRVSVREALERSLNVAAARLGQRVGIERVIQVAHRLGVRSSLPEVPSLALGSGELSPLEVARVYATLANGGVRPSPHTYEDVVTQTGERVARRQIELERVLDPGTAFLAVSLLEGVVERGTAARVRAMGLRGPIAGKTGTSDDERDLWFVGFTPELVAVVWVGFDEPRGVGAASSRIALPIWVDFVQEALGSEIPGAFLRPPQIEEHAIEPTTGALALRGCPEQRTEYFLPGTEPAQTCPEGARRGGDDVDRGLLDWLRRWL